ncbi:palmitoyltransferase ZDHHC15-like [Tropilaelaps mercedesae]|uniref:Palmitoyltransferase n=1 Tax=Tropilaelaps mercedesae TaxID=418985 RepID=A0A1V9Y2U4_9ACAR|nr:palmitoyltransferase ZDHHC15-like [Tropilaelaps mercedesae]
MPPNQLPLSAPGGCASFWTNYWGGMTLVLSGSLVVGCYIYSVLLCIITEDDPVSFIVLATLVFAELGLLLWSYAATHLTQPTEIPPRFRFTPGEWAYLEEHNFQMNVVHERLSAMAAARGVRTRSYAGHVNFCYQCRIIKPERAHHCSLCCRCIPRMDHHCPYFGNCIHFGNFKFFLLTLFHATVGCLIIALSTGIYIVVSGKGLNRLNKNVMGLSLFSVMLITCVIVVLSVGGFFCMSMKQAMHNMTTLESIGGTVLFAGGSKETYDLGSYMLNLRQLLGPVVAAWFLPIHSTPGDGVTFPVRSEVASTKECDDALKARNTLTRVVAS